MRLSSGKEGNFIMILGYLGQNAEPAATGGPTSDNPKAGVRKALEPIAALGGDEVNLYTWNTDFTAQVTSQLEGFLEKLNASICT